MKKNLILLHGFCESKEMWDDFEMELSKPFDVHCLNLPGFGDFHFDVSGLSISEIAQIVQNGINELQLDDYVIVGHSLGGYVALELVNQFPNKVKGLGLFHSTCFADSEERKSKRNDVIQFIEKHGSSVFGKSFIPQLFYQPLREKCESDIEKLTEIAANTSQVTLVEVTKAMQTRSDHTSLLRKLNIPVLFIVGKHDGSVPLTDSMLQCHLPKHAIIQVLDDCGHMGMFEQSEKIQCQLHSFVNCCY